MHGYSYSFVVAFKYSANKTSNMYTKTAHSLANVNVIYSENYKTAKLKILYIITVKHMR